MKYRKKPVVIEAMQFTGENFAEIDAWTDGKFTLIREDDRGDNPEATGDLWVAANGVWVAIEPTEWVLRDALGFYPCKASVFNTNYEPAKGETE